MPVLYNFGSVNIDHIYRVPHLVQPGETLSSHDYQTVLGGKGANQSLALAKAGVQVRHIGRYHANDGWVREQLEAGGVDCSLLKTTATPTGHAIIQVDDQGQNSIVLFAGANHSFQADESLSLFADAAAGDWLLLQNECNQADSMIRAAVAQGLQVAMNPAPMDDQVKDLPLEHLSVLIVNEIEAASLFGLAVDEVLQLPQSEVAQQLLQQQARQRCPKAKLMITLGSQGAIGFEGKTAGTDWVFVPAEQVAAVDTTGAGDTFSGYALSALMLGQPLEQAMRLGSKAAALCVQRAGASISIPTLVEVTG